MSDPNSLDDLAAALPPLNTVRWTAARKACVVLAINAGIISAEKACRDYSMSREELADWSRRTEEFGAEGLRATKVREYRHARHAAE